MQLILLIVNRQMVMLQWFLYKSMFPALTKVLTKIYCVNSLLKDLLGNPKDRFCRIEAHIILQESIVWRIFIMVCLSAILAPGMYQCSQTLLPH